MRYPVDRWHAVPARRLREMSSVVAAFCRWGRVDALGLSLVHAVQCPGSSFLASHSVHVGIRGWALHGPLECFGLEGREQPASIIVFWFCLFFFSQMSCIIYMTTGEVTLFFWVFVCSSYHFTLTSAL